MTKFQLNRPDGPWDYAVYGFRAASGAILDGTLFTPAITTPPDSWWSVYVGGSAQTGITPIFAYGTPSPYVPPPDGTVPIFRRSTGTYQLLDAVDFFADPEVALALEGAAGGGVSDNAITILANDLTTQFRTALNAIIASAGYGIGTVTQVAGQTPDGSGHVSLAAADVGALPAVVAGNQMAQGIVLGSNGAAVPAGTPDGTVIFEPPVGASPVLRSPTLADAFGPVTVTPSPGPTLSGSRLVMYVNLQAATSITDSAGNTWTKRASTADAGATGSKVCEVWDCIGANPVTSVTVNTPAGVNAQVIFCEVTGGSGAGITNRAQSTSGTTTTAIPVTVLANALMLGAVIHGTAVTSTISSPFADVVSQSARSTTMLKLDSYTPVAGGSYGPSWTISASASKAVILYAVNP